jgi:hypothetical protein
VWYKRVKNPIRSVSAYKHHDGPPTIYHILLGDAVDGLNLLEISDKTKTTAKGPKRQLKLLSTLCSSSFTRPSQILCSGRLSPHLLYAFDYHGTLHLFDYALQEQGSSRKLAKLGLVRKLLKQGRNYWFMNLQGEICQFSEDKAEYDDLLL